ncbi:coiled-coil domain-containing protein [Collinsella provencensis]|uniref:coiled-coil domain-containing protein n=1 Tax=Collinsella provencensis TaxID=1937461 RepID=UPI000C84BA12|nr:NlpC/P60 family protein [Collinsella provencensis]
MTHFKRSHAVIPIAALAVTLGFGLVEFPMQSYGVTSAELQSELDAASKQLNNLYSQAEQAGYDLHAVQADLQEIEESISETEAQIEEEEQQLAELQGELGVLAAGQYKDGGLSLITLLFNSDDLGTLVSNIRYADKIAEHHQNVIAQSKELQKSLDEKKASLEADKAEQEKLVEEQQARADAANAAAAEAQAYYDQLSDEVKAKIEEEQAAERERARQEAEQARKDAENSASSGSNSGSNGGSSSGSGSNGGSGNGGSTNNGGGSSSGGSHTTSSAANAMTARAWGIIGSGYSWSGYRWTGDVNTSVFTCSGVVDYALGLPTNSNSPESLYGAVGSNLTRDIGKLAYGDLVFFRTGGRSPGHVGIYVGGGSMIDSCPGGGVQVRSLSYIGGFLGGGPIV